MKQLLVAYSHIVYLSLHSNLSKVYHEKVIFQSDCEIFIILIPLKQKSGRAGGQAARPVFVFFARDAVPITPNAAPEAAEQTMLQLPFEKENGMEELAFAQQ
ncbi:MAG: hypothetical protein UC451_00305 [Faecalibacterium sp.]|nr:hypothetical protein [Faecalibacterium sp.]